MLERAFELLQDDGFATIDYLSQQNDAHQVIDTYKELVLKSYWEKKDLSAVICMAIAGIQYALSTARALETSNPQESTEFRQEAKRIAYNLASFTWPGWDEAGITIGKTEQQIGLWAAKLNLRLAQELERGDLPLSRAHWALAGHYLPDGQYNQARKHYAESARYARDASARSEELLAIGFSAATTLLEVPGDEAAQQQLAEVKTELANLKHGQDFIGQVETAMSVFS